MALTHIPLEQITEGHLEHLTTVSAAESLYIDYKRQSYGGNDEQRREFLADISSFANASGGDLVIGMTESGGMAKGFHPFTDDANAERERLEQMARDGLQPRIGGLQTRAVPLAAGGHVIIVRIPKSYNPPHRVIFKNSARFWARTSAGKYEPNVEELRHIFTSAPQFAERIKSLRMERIARIAAHETPVPISAGRPILALHIMPYSAFDMRQTVSFTDIESKWQQFAPIGSRYPEHYRINFDGFLTLSNADENAPEQRAYVQIFRSGVVEAVAVLAGPGLLKTIELEAYIVRSAGRLINALHPCGVEPPFAVLASLIGTSGCSFITGNEMTQHIVGWRTTGAKADRDQYHFVEAVLESVPANDRDTAPTLKPILDHLAGLAGKSSTPTFDAGGNYTLNIGPLS